MINNKISDENNLNQKPIKKSSGVWKGRLFLLLVIAAAVGGYFFYQYSIEKRNQDYAEASKLDNSWNIVYESEADKYVGQHIFTITEKDENGNNTWDGLILYVVDNKIKGCGRADTTPLQEVYDKLYEGNDVGMFTAIINPKLRDTFPVDVDDTLKIDKSLFISTDTSNMGGGELPYIVRGAGYLDLENEVDYAAKYGGLKALGLQSAYDDNVKAILFDKLLKNPNSPYIDSNKYIINEWTVENSYSTNPLINDSEIESIFNGIRR